MNVNFLFPPSPASIAQPAAAAPPFITFRHFRYFFVARHSFPLQRNSVALANILRFIAN